MLGTHLAPFQGWDPEQLLPRACARGYTLTPLRG